MAAQSRLALRSSGRSSQGLEDLPATVVQRNPSTVHSKKRPHSLTTNHDNGRSIKRTQNDLDNTLKSRNIKVYSRKLNAESISAPAAEATKAVTHARPRHPPPQSTPIVPQPRNTPTIDPTSDSSLLSNTDVIPSLKTQHTATVNRVDRRSLRSHGGSRFKSELASYFADYDEVLSGEPKKQEILTPQTRVHVVDEPSAPFASTGLPPLALEHGVTAAHPVSLAHDRVIEGNVEINDQLKSNHFELNNAERLDLSSAERHSRHITEDPLTDQLYFKAHRRAERAEKQHRNREKESAQHEHSQLERILGELQGQAWLKTMGITGITDSERRSYEPKRMIFIQRVTALLDKFKVWKEEEKRRKAERERSCTIDEDVGDESDQSDSLVGLDGIDERISSTGRYTANSRAKRVKQRRSAAAPTDSSIMPQAARSHYVNLLPIPVEKPFTSFFSKPYQRESALSGHRRGRQRFAFGQQIPELEQRDFSLSPDWLTRNVLAANARSRRAAKRDQKDE
ncbi:MAG: hypothetical protein Q9209_000806 [Squamulea sp. 1 TL-2023]